MDSLTTDFLNKALKVSLPPNIAARGGWKFDINALVDACGALDLQKEVRLRFTAGGTKTGHGTLGAHRIQIDMDTEPIKFYHGITISQDLGIEQANEFLWHEFRHAWQAEQVARVSGKAISVWGEIYKKADGKHGEAYNGNKFELDANTFAARMVAEGNMLVQPRNR